MTDEKDHARRPEEHHESEPKAPSSLPGPNRFPKTARYGEALAPGTIPDEEREKREREVPEKHEKGRGVERP